MVGFDFDKMKEQLVWSGLYILVRTMQYMIPQSNHHFFTILERYNSETCMFFTLVEEIGFALHEMHEVSGLVMGIFHMKNKFRP